ncbi:MAG: alanine/ornithine racemase family PLP-dependent enzyme [Ignavibacteriales bacterium]
MSVSGGFPRVEIRLDGIRHNARNLAGRCRESGIEVTGVTKGACGHPAVARAMLEGGVARIGDSRLLNLERLRAAGIAAEMVLIRIPMLSEAARVPLVASSSLNSEVQVIRALGEAAGAAGRTHGIILMVDVGERREGIPPCDVLRTCREISRIPGVRLEALGTNVACFNGVLPTRENVQVLADLARDAGREIGQEVGVSGGNTATTLLLETGEMPGGVTGMRIGEGILLGTDISNSRAIPGAVQDTFILVAEVVEVQDKPSMPEGVTGCDSFGCRPVFVDKGIRRRAIVAVGKQDVEVAGITPVDPGIEIAGASSDHLILDVTSAPTPVRLGDTIRFRPNYPAVLRLMTSAYVEKVLL